MPTYGKVGIKRFNLFNMREKYPTPELGREKSEEEWAENRATELIEKFLGRKEEEETNRIRDLFMRFEGLNKEEATEKAHQEMMRRKKERGQWILSQEETERGRIEKELGGELEGLPPEEKEKRIKRELEEREKAVLDFQARNLLSDAILYEGKWSQDWPKREKILEHGLEAAKNEVRKQWEEEKKMAKEG